MSETPSNMLPLGTIAPDFNLPDTITGQHKTLQQLKGDNGTVVMFICNHCPYVQHVKSTLIEMAHQYAPKGVTMIAISSNDVVNYPQDAPDKMQVFMQEWGNPFAAYLYDESQETAKAYQAACTPDFYVFDAGLSCVYRGRLDSSTPKNDQATDGADLRSALDYLLNNKGIYAPQLPSIGCNIKWKA